MALNPNLQEALAKKTGLGWQECQKQLDSLFKENIKKGSPYVAIALKVDLRESMTKMLRNWLRTNGFEERVIIQAYGQYPTVVVQLLEELAPGHVVQPTHIIGEGWKFNDGSDF